MADKTVSAAPAAPVVFDGDKVAQHLYGTLALAKMLTKRLEDLGEVAECTKDAHEFYEAFRVASVITQRIDTFSEVLASCNVTAERPATADELRAVLCLHDSAQEVAA